MSGPKSYSPPPRYSMQVFDGKLNEVFRLQSRLKMLCAELETSRVADAKLDIYFDCREDLDGKRKMLDKALKMLVFDYRGTFGQETYNRIESEIRNRVADLQTSLNQCELIKSQFEAHRKDYESYCSYLQFYDNSKTSFDDFKKRIRQYLKKNLEEKSPAIFQEVDKEISRVEFEKSRSSFDFGFDRRSETERQSVINHITEKEKVIYKLKDKTGEQIRAEIFGTASDNLSEEKSAVIEKIQTIIRRCDNAAIKSDYESELKKLTESGVLRDVYFFKQLHDAVLESERTRHARAAIAGLLKQINETEFHPSIENEKRNLANLCFALLDRSSIAPSETDNLRLKLKQIERQSREYFEEDEIAGKERLFLKSQIILCLENLGYEVMDDLEVIDFETETDFLMKIKNQENYLNLKFKSDGSMRYIFQIPENESELSTDQKNLKLHEMQVTCDEFKTVLEDLSKMGLKVNLQSERAVAPESIVSVPRNLRDKIKTKAKGRQQTSRLREKYLDR